MRFVVTVLVFSVIVSGFQNTGHNGMAVIGGIASIVLVNGLWPKKKQDWP